MGGIARTLLNPYIAGFLSLASSIVRSAIHAEGDWRIAVALLPSPFFVLLLVSVILAVRRLDELEQRIQLEALAIGSLGTAILTQAYGHLQRDGVLALRAWDDVWVCLGLVYLLGLVVARVRYR